MRWTGKLIGGLIGLILFGPIGAILGFFLGHIIDQNFLQAFHTHFGNVSGIQQIFFRSTFTIMGYLAKVDGHVSEQEIEATRRVMQQMGLNPEMQQQAIRYFNEGKQPNFNVNQAVEELRRACMLQPALLQMFIEIQMYLAYADGQITAVKQQALEQICNQLGIASFIFRQYEQQQRAEQNYQRHQHRPNYNPQHALKDAYDILGVTKETSDDDLKKAYRRLMSKHHPDKLIAQGVPPEMVKIATQKTQQIMNAYEAIKKSRGMP